MAADLARDRSVGTASERTDVKERTGDVSAASSRSNDRLRPHPWTPRKAAALFFVSYLAVQVSIPIVQLLEDGPRRFGWQMFSRVGHMRPDFFLVTERGVEPVSLDRHVLHLRSEIDLTRELPPHLCTVYPEAEAVRGRDPSGRVSSFPCARAEA